MNKTPWWQEIIEFFQFFGNYFKKRFLILFANLEEAKSFLVGGLVAQRGKYARPFLHTSMGGLMVLGILLAPLVGNNIQGMAYNPWEEVEVGGEVLASRTFQNEDLTTQVSVKPRANVVNYTVQQGDTVSAIADKFGVSTDTIRWQNNLKSINDISPGDELEILPVTGVAHKVKRGETVYSIAKKYDASPQAIVDYPFNDFANDETFSLTAGQNLMVPDGVKPKAKPWSPSTSYVAQTPDAGAVSAVGQFVWPASGYISQRYSWYHRGLDIANSASPDIVAADSGTVTVAGWPDGFGLGNRVVIDHGNGYVTVYGHFSKVYVRAGQTVNRGDALGRMGTTGRSTGIHLHFEVRKNGAPLNPLSFLQ